MSKSSTDCVFCGILDGKIPAEAVYQDEFVMAFWDANPSAPIHILIVPRRHIPTLNDIHPDDAVLSHIGRAAVKIAEDFGVAESGYRFFINVNRGGGQVIFHLHAHLVSRTGTGAKRQSEE
ncbi:MAG: histidine triad nucleotide-binding protein [Desulfomonile tiedjei]|uniref:Histidine triad nucleotide-binding protein n=1 Tax=Desulfomonile tiedjei TaxID=2358 RepID=A0A9D6V2R9_9BACT|nr:histidine triad nucleotide-binding protein [Desulfomonile tiedjei]